MINRLFAYCLLTAAVAGQQIPELEAIKRLEAAKQFKNAALRAEQIILQYPSRWEPHHAAAQNWGRVRRFRKAQTHLEIARQINPDVAKVLFDLASVLYNQAKWDEALHYFRELQAQLEGTENRITVARNRHIEAIRGFNDLVTVPPSSLTNSLFYGHEKMAQWTLDDVELEQVEQAPNVAF